MIDVALLRFACREVGLLAFALATVAAHAEPIAVVAAESVYGNIAREIGGGNVSVMSILASADQDPHEFEAAAGTALALAKARLVLYNGAGYDPWVARLLSATVLPSRTAIEVAALVRRGPGENPHLWYDVGVISALAETLATKLSEIDPEHRLQYADGRAAFEATLVPLRARIATMRASYAGTPVTATEPVFEYMANALGLSMRNARFQLAMMNETEPGARTIAAFENDLRSRAVRALLYNTQTEQSLAERMRRIAEQTGVPVVLVTETQPPDTTYAQWMLKQLEALDRALARQ